jgi:hypothetical protein
MDPSADPPGRDEAEHERRRRALRQVEGGSRSPLQQGQLPRALRAVSIALALLGLAAWWFVTQEQKRQAEEALAVPPASAPGASAPAVTPSPPGDAGKAAGTVRANGATNADSGPAPAAGTPAKPAIGSFDRDRGRPLDRDRPQDR